jgi:hypothetical protein
MERSAIRELMREKSRISLRSIRATVCYIVPLINGLVIRSWPMVDPGP